MHTLTLVDIPHYGDGSIDLPNGYTLRIETKDDPHMDAPWENAEGHGPVTKWRKYGRGYYGTGKAPGERPLVTDGGTTRFYDWQEATRLARRDGWGLGGDKLAKLTKSLGRTPTAGQIREAAVEHDFQFLKGWCNDDWRYVGVIVSLLNADENKVAEDSLWGVESCGEYWRECALGMAQTLIEQHEEELADRQALELAAV